MDTLLRSVLVVMRRLAEVTLFLMMCLTMLDVVGRYFLNFPVLGSVELTELLMVGVIFSGIALSSASRGHITVDLIAIGLHGRVRWLQQVLGDGIALGISILLAMVSWGKAAEITDYGDKTAVLLIPIAPVAVFMAIMLSITTLYHLIQFIQTVLKGPAHD
ncbi:hypothetical protein PAEH1_09710 [Paenalcaligenes hominis]|uniref:TRAP transporter small permease protein n=1 Tax=Paenalcaligenes hominis TaxID=643674 RepID=A0A1U9K172_9BURK|nr:TRAP transporter small permease [Paenalcaligenes hominis]AQS51768.1 hypothetical protein PAEH1_09710 [Paenalcaligenes hominis]